MTARESFCILLKLSLNNSHTIHHFLFCNPYNVVEHWKEVLTRQKGEHFFIFPRADGTAKLSGRVHEFREPTLRRAQPVGSEDLSGELQGEPEGPQPTETKDDAEARADFWSMQGGFICRHHIEPQVQLIVPKEETFPIPPKYMDVTRSAHTNLDVLQESRIDDYWNVDVKQSLSDSWKGFTKFTLLKEKTPKGYMESGRRLTKNQATTRPENVWLEVWTKIGKAAQKREKQEWAIEKPELDNARRLRGIYFIDPGRWWIQRNHQKTEGESWKFQWMRQCLARKEQSSAFRKLKRRVVNPRRFQKTKHACIVEVHETTRQRLESSPPEDHEDHIAWKKDIIRWHTTILFTSLFPCLRWWKIPDAKAAVDKEWKKLETIPAWDLTKVRSRSEVIDEARKKDAKVHFASLMDICHLKNAEFETKHQFQIGNASFVHCLKRLFLSVYVDDIKLAGKKQNIDPMWKLLNKEVDLGEPTSFLDHEKWQTKRRLFWTHKEKKKSTLLHWWTSVTLRMRS